ncbi:MAG: HAD-IC family P-type ATPase [Candidatus Pacebacteria bacterium]|nr:HAD-IC family P-type ATPase [Candidatus Paceibacterota bacterium]
MPDRQSLQRKSLEIARIAARHLFLPINAIIFGVVILLIVFGDAQEGLFLGAVVLVNIALGFGQDVRAWFTLEKLQILTAVRIHRINDDGTETEVMLPEIRKGDRLRIKLGDQVPCDSTLLLSNGVEINEGLITGESDTIQKKTGDELLAGSVITAGGGVIKVETPFAESRVAKMAEGLKRYTTNPSPIQLSIQKIIEYTVYTLLATIALVVIRGALVHEPQLRIVENIGALASVLVPQGLVVTVTLLFTFGGAHFYNRHVLLQEVNATEKFGHIKNLCVDKTGTLTENELTVERMLIPAHEDLSRARTFAAAYVQGSQDSSQLVSAMEKYLAGEQAPEIADTLPFSSWRQYGGVCIPGSKSECILAGAPEAFIGKLEPSERVWLQAVIDEQTRDGKHVTCIVRATESTPQVPRTLGSEKLSIVAVFVQSNKLREGIQDAIAFFQNRGVTIRVLTGDHPETAHVVAQRCGIRNADKVITGVEMNTWDVEHYLNHAKNYTVFARIKPEQKERIIEALKQDGFTAMVGDGANDALSLKKADLGIAMAEGAAAARQVSAVILTKNSFVELPGGVQLADSMIENIEIYASIFMNQTFLSFFLFLILTLLNHDFPLAPLNISYINYFAIGMPGALVAYWAIRPHERTIAVSKRPFLERVLPLPFALALLQTAAAIGVFYFSLTHGLTSSSLLVLFFIALGYFYFLLAPSFHTGRLNWVQSLQLAGLGIFECIVLLVTLQIPLVQTFFMIAPPTAAGAYFTIVLALITAAAMFLLALMLLRYRTTNESR